MIVSHRKCSTVHTWTVPDLVNSETYVLRAVADTYGLIKDITSCCGATSLIASQHSTVSGQRI